MFYWLLFLIPILNLSYTKKLKKLWLLQEMKITILHYRKQQQ